MTQNLFQKVWDLHTVAELPDGRRIEEWTFFRASRKK